jgi:2,4-dienoyl-CoA reductase-like NADH-dependent reductase (Old Yellow Enzyme family)
MEPPSGSGGLTACTVMTRPLGGGVEVRLKVAFFRGFTILTAMVSLFDPVTLGDLTLSNRIIMAPLTRCRAAPGRVPRAVNALYYTQRAGAGLIISEATAVDPMGVGYPDTPGIWTDAQVAGWSQVTSAVHAAGGRIVLQLWHVGRISDPSLLGGELPVAPSAIAPAGQVSLLRPVRPFVTPRALRLDEMPGIIEGFRLGAANARRAGFDGVEIHGANGYLLDQFLQSASNQRTDRYGGSIENRARLALEITDAVLSVWPAGRVGYHLNPRGGSHDVTDANPAETFGYLATELGPEASRVSLYPRSPWPGPPQSGLAHRVRGAVVANDGFTAETASEAELAAGQADAVAFGRLFISNPDLPVRLRRGAPLLEPDRTTFNAPGSAEPERGYTDYPTLAA